MEIISAQHIVKRFHNHTALNDASISVPDQSIFGLLGPNGAGKTTLIRIINQITMPELQSYRVVPVLLGKIDLKCGSTYYQAWC